MVKIYLTYQEVKQLHIIRRHFFTNQSQCTKKETAGRSSLGFCKNLTSKPQGHDYFAAFFFAWSTTALKAAG